MKRLLTLLMCFVAIAAMAQEDTGELQKYRRSSLYTVLIKHSQLPYGTTIDSAFMQMPLPDKFNDHNLALRSFESSAKKVKKDANNKKKDAKASFNSRKEKFKNCFSPSNKNINSACNTKERYYKNNPTSYSFA